MNSTTRFALAVCAVLATALPAHSADNPDFRIRAKFRDSNNESVGNADFRIKSRFLQVYYGGVTRSDEYRFKVDFDFTDISGFDASFIGSIHDTDYDIYINSILVGQVDMNAAALGIGELEYDRRNPSPPALPLPANFPDPVNTFDTVRMFAAGASFNSDSPLFEGELIEEFARGDANVDGKLDEDDFSILAANYDPGNLFELHISPANGDFTGDNQSNSLDHEALAKN